MRFYPQQCLRHPSDLSSLQSRYGMFVCGSDQVWNTDITHHDYSYFRIFVGQSEKAAYAPSFGLEFFTLHGKQEHIANY